MQQISLTFLFVQSCDFYHPVMLLLFINRSPHITILAVFLVFISNNSNKCGSWNDFISKQLSPFCYKTKISKLHILSKQMARHRMQTSARVSLLRVKIENETSEGKFWELRMRVLREKMRVENESSERKMRVDIENEGLEFSRTRVWIFCCTTFLDSIKTESAFLQTLSNEIFKINAWKL